MTKVALTENSVIEISIKVRLTVFNLSIASKVYYDTDEEMLVDYTGRIWSPLVMLENIGNREYEILTSDEDFEDILGLSIHEYPELETYISKQ
jgi:hypothetical protein